MAGQPARHKPCPEAQGAHTGQARQPGRRATAMRAGSDAGQSHLAAIFQCAASG